MFKNNHFNCNLCGLDDYLQLSMPFRIEDDEFYKLDLNFKQMHEGKLSMVKGGREKCHINLY